jgi:hypothetical protein
MEDNRSNKETRIFNFVAGVIVFVLGCGLLIKNFFIVKEMNGYELVIGLELIAGGIFIVHGKFKGFNLVKNES